MDIADIISTDFVALRPDDAVSKLVGVFEDPAVNGVVVRDDAFRGVVTRRQLASSQHPPEETVGSLVWHVPRLSPDDDVRKVARLMIDADSRVLPVFEGSDLVGVVTVDDVVEAVEPFLDAATVREAATSDMITVGPDATFGRALSVLREHGFTHLPVVDDDDAVGILSLHDVVDVTTRAETRSRGGNAGGTDAGGGQIAASTARVRAGGFGARDGERARVLDLPVRDVMVAPVRTIHPDETLDVAVAEMFDVDGSSLVVTENGDPSGIVTKTDVLDALTWETGGSRAVQVSGTDLLDDVQYDDVVEMVDTFDAMDGDTNVLDAKVHLHEHEETHRGTPLLLARIRLHTDDGLFIASGEGYGANHALHEARDVIERQVRDDKTYGRTKKPPSPEFWDKRFGWLLEE
ncbi:CBS domain-containing protein [Halorubellus sp. PRR65]|uniref:CBS domain-containing protein n=1 Tax=Halorubellus sp. PRR65 TaxID=3098148 RepID=UPI002B25A530|nr:CBS domain-containing protein [Halorubellus sp. PRR65]